MNNIVYTLGAIAWFILALVVAFKQVELHPLIGATACIIVAVNTLIITHLLK